MDSTGNKPTRIQETIQPSTTTKQHLPHNTCTMQGKHQEPDNVLTTKHGRLLERLLGKSEKLKEFDRIRCRIKTLSKNQAAALKSKHDTLLAEFQTAVQSEKTAILSQIKNLEMSHLEAHNVLPSEKNTTHQQLMHRYSLAQRLLTTWNIQL